MFHDYKHYHWQEINGNAAGQSQKSESNLIKEAILRGNRAILQKNFVHNGWNMKIIKYDSIIWNKWVITVIKHRCRLSFTVLCINNYLYLLVWAACWPHEADVTRRFGSADMTLTSRLSIYSSRSLVCSSFFLTCCLNFCIISLISYNIQCMSMNEGITPRFMLHGSFALVAIGVTFMGGNSAMFLTKFMSLVQRYTCNLHCSAHRIKVWNEVIVAGMHCLTSNCLFQSQPTP